MQPNVESLNGIMNEPGIVRNKHGRILSTGWPDASTSSWPLAYEELQSAVQKQIKLEETLRTYGTRDLFGTIKLGSGIFCLGGTTLLPDLQQLLTERMAKVSTGDLVEVCDIGGGNGRLLDMGTIYWRNPHSRDYIKRHQLATTLTTLINHDDELLETRRHSIDNLVIGMAIELPLDNFFQRFDVVVAQNSIFFWSNYPELALQNIFKICKPHGEALVTVPRKPVNITGEENFSMEDAVWDCKLFHCTQIGKSDEYVALRLKKFT